MAEKELTDEEVKKIAQGQERIAEFSSKQELPRNYDYSQGKPVPFSKVNDDNED